MNRKVSLALALIVAFAASAVVLNARADGVVDHKAITGTRDSISYTIVTITETEVIVKDEEFNEDFKVSTTINETLAHRLDSWYDEINYIISVRTGDETVAYFVSREDFNKVDNGGRIRYTILRFKSTTIRIIKILD